MVPVVWFDNENIIHNPFTTDYGIKMFKIFINPNLDSECINIRINNHFSDMDPRINELKICILTNGTAHFLHCPTNL